MVLCTPVVTASNLMLRLGSGFLLVANLTAGTTTAQISRYTWSYADRSWSHSVQDGLDGGTYWLTAGAQYYFFLDHLGSSGLYWLDSSGTWQSSSGTKPAWWPASNPPLSSISLSAGEALVAVGYLTGSGTTPYLNSAIFAWNSQHVVQTMDNSSVNGNLPVSGISPPLGTAVIVQDTVVAFGPWVWRFDGQNWLLNKQLYYSQTGGSVRYSHGADVSLCVALSSSTATPRVRALAYDENTAWDKLSTTTPAQTVAAASGSWGSTQNWPNAGGQDWLLIGRYLYFRGDSPTWATALAGTPLDLQCTVNAEGSNQFLVNSQSLVNQGPLFVAFNVIDSKNNNAATAFTLGIAPLVNGGILGGKPLQLSADKLSDGGEGAGAAGQATLCTFPAGTSSFSDATSITLRRYAGDSIAGDPTSPTPQLSGNIRHYAVTSFFVDDGINQHSTQIVADPSTAACDSSGTVAKYYSTTLLPGAIDTSSAPYGKVQNTYINGLSGDTAGADVMQDGLLSTVQIQDPTGAVLSTLAMGWQVYRQRAAGPMAPAVKAPYLYGGFVVRNSISRDSAGVTATRSSSYVQDGFVAPWSSSPVSTITSRYGSTGTLESSSTYTTGAATISAHYAALNMLSTQAGQRTTWQSGSSSPVSSRASASLAVAATNRLGVSVPAQSATYTWKGTGSAVFPYGDTSVLSDWALTGAISQRDTWGLVGEQTDAGGILSSSRRSSSLSLPIAGANGVGLSRWRATTFEQDDPAEGFSFPADSWSENCWMGTRSLNLLPGAALSVVLPVSPGTLLWSVWINAAAGESLELSGDGLPTQTMAGTGKWSHTLLPLAIGSSSSALSLSLKNVGTTPALVDMVAVAPLQCGLVMQTVDAASRQVTAQSSLGGVTTRNLHSRAGGQIGQVGSGNQLLEWSVSGMSRRATDADSFTPSHPNARWTLQPAGSAHVETFRQGDDWTQRWTPSNNGWTQSQGSLSFSGSLSSPVSGPFAVVAEVTQQGSGWIGFQLGGLAIGWNQGWSWPGGPTPITTPTQMGSLWMLVVADGQLLLIVDGLLIFSGPYDAGDLTQISLDSGNSTASVRNLGLLNAPRLSVIWQDGSSQEHQRAYRDGADSRVSAVLRDVLGRTVASTRTAPGSCGSGAHLAPMAFRSGFVDEAAFLANLANSWEMQGDVVTYYADEDGAFPYAGTRYEASPRKRSVEQGAPSAALAITNVQDQPASDRATTSFVHETVSVGDGQMQQRSSRNQVGRQSQSLQSGPRSVVAAQTFDSSGAGTGRASRVTTWQAADDGGICTLIRQTPNGGGTGVPTESDPYVSVSVLDARRRQLRLQDPDSGTTQFWYSSDGQVRFAAPAGSNPIYHRYDGRGRLIELGSFDQPEDSAILAANVDNQAWPDSTVPTTTLRTWSWDGDGSRPEELGTNTQVVSTLPAPEGFSNGSTITESFQHDANGRVVQATLDVQADCSFNATLGYVYNTMGEVIEIHYPSGSPIPVVYYSYNDQGQVQTIGTTTGGDDIARYTYTPDGAIDTETRGGSLVGQHRWSGSGWYLGQTMMIESDTLWSYSSPRNADGSVSSITEMWAGEAGVQTTCGYDGNGRLSYAEPDSGPGNEQVTQYDANGNVLAASLDGNSFTASLAGANNKLGSLSLGGSSSSVSNNAAGYLMSYADLSLEVNPGLGLASRAQRGSTNIRLAYGGQGQQALRQVAGGTTRFVHCGAGSVPLVWSTDGQITQAVWGPSGLVMLADQNGQHSLHGLVDATGKRVARWSWSAFGSLVDSEAGSVDCIFGYQGQIWDADLKLHSFVARLYDPSLRRFLAPDAARQYASPYVFVGNNPLQNIDPSGNASAANIAAGVTTAAIAAVTVVGLALSVFTFGASDAVAAGIDASLAAADAAEVGATVAVDAAEVAVDVSVEAGTEAAVEGGAEAATEAAVEGSTEAAGAGSAGASEVSVGAEAGAARAETAGGAAEAGTGAAESTGTKVLKKLGTEALKGGAKGAMRSGIKYNVQGISEGDWSVKGFLAAMGKGFGTGAVSGMISGACELGLARVVPGSASFNKVGQACMSAASNALSTAISNDLGQVVTNAKNGDPLYSQLGRSTVSGAISGVANFAACEAITRTVGAPAAFTVAVGATLVSTGAGVVSQAVDPTTSLSGS